MKIRAHVTTVVSVTAVALTTGLSLSASAVPVTLPECTRFNLIWTDNLESHAGLDASGSEYREEVITLRSMMLEKTLAAALSQSTANGAELQSDSHSQQSNTSPAAPELRSTLPVPIEHEPSLNELDNSKNQVWRRATLNLSGSRCLACLLDLQEQLQHKRGVEFVQVRRAPAPQAEARENRRNIASAVIVYDLRFTNLKRLDKCIRSAKYQASEIVESKQW